MASTVDVDTTPMPTLTSSKNSVSAGCRSAHHAAPINNPCVTFGDDDFIEHDDYDVTNPDRKDSTGSTHSSDLHVGFSLNLDDVTADDDALDVNENAATGSGCNGGGRGGSGHRRFLTAKYKKNKIGIVRRRIEVEDWIDKELKKIYDIPENSYDSYDAELDLDEMIDLPNDNERRSYIEQQLTTSTKPVANIDAFIVKLLAKIAALQ